jgi:hypothetical protein
MSTQSIESEVRDRLEVVETLYRFAAGLDFNDENLLKSVFATDVVVDFTEGNRLWGSHIPVLKGLDQVMEFLRPIARDLDTTHTVTNPRTEIHGDTAKLYAMVEPRQLHPKDHSRYCLMKNRYDVDLVRNGKHWVIKKMIVTAAWFTGDTRVVLELSPPCPPSSSKH